MITKVVHGWRPGGLIAYLMGPGRAEEHRNPRVIASWDGRDAAWQPARTGPGEWDLALGPLIRALRAPAVAAGLPEEADETGRRGYVWHCSARLAATDRVLSDAEWAEVARELLDAAGIAGRDDPGGPRWVAVRHAEDHIHIAAVLVRQDTARRFWPHRDYPRLREAARRIEDRLGLTPTAAGDGTAARAPNRGEIEKARRRGRREPVRIELARAVREAAVVAGDADSFIAALREAGYVAELRRAPSGDPIGFTVGLADDVSSAGVPVRYSGSKLAPDLSLPKLLRRWAELDAPGPGGRPAFPAARRAAERAQRTVADARRTAGGGEDPAEIAHAAADLLTALRGWPGSGTDLGTAADLFDRASRPPRSSPGRPGSSTSNLRRTAHLLIRQRRVAGEGDLDGVVALAVALTALLREIAAWQREHGRPHQATAASASADVVERWSATGLADDDQGATPAPERVGGHAPDHGRVAVGPRDRTVEQPPSRQPRG
ncbi:relaxase/mobilization nuclease domain-containing protein [Pseudonocardia lacus]|uniref:relaxase/mobilization nuclease domain-containing protein n=1 Tax=Pseudonocardia lacus TaxID=2835865 RepID=UPI001BDD49E1|nr:hypothetical protein [Pseudonocardia lacus]